MFGKNSLKYLLGILLLLSLFTGAHQKVKLGKIDPLDKIHFDLSQLNEGGLYGPSDGLRPISYEFCIPASERLVEEVTTIDSTVKLYPDSPGRIGCSDDEYLCVGNTHQKNYKEALFKLASLEYIKKIEQSFFEY